MTKRHQVRNAHRLAALGAIFTLLALHHRTIKYLTTHALGHATGDLVAMHLPIWDWAQRTLGHGFIPLWNPHILCGYPQWASGELSLTTLLGPLLALPLPAAINLWWILTQALAALFAMRWLRALRLSPMTCFLGGTSAALCSAVTYRIPAGHPNIPACFPWAFLLLSAWTLWWRTGHRRHLLVAMVAWALLLLSSHLQIAYEMILWFGIVALVTSVKSQRGWVKRFLSGMIAIALPGTLAAAVLWLPQMEFALVSERGGFDVFLASSVSFPAESLLTLLLPGCFGAGITDPITGEVSPFVGRWTFFWESSLFLAPLVTGSLFLRRSRRHTQLEVALWISVVFFTLIALGRQTPVFEIAYRWLPGLHFLRGPAKFMNPVLFSLIVLGAIRFDRFIRRSPRLIRPTLTPRKIVALALCLICFGLLFATMFAKGSFQTLADLPLHADAIEKFPSAEFNTADTIAYQVSAPDRLKLFTDATSLAMSGWIALMLLGLVASVSLHRRSLIGGLLVALNLVICALWTLPNLTLIEEGAIAYPVQVREWLQQTAHGGRVLWLGRNLRNLGARCDISAVNGNCSTLGQRQADLFRLAFRHSPGTLENDALVYDLAVSPQVLGIRTFATIDSEVPSPADATQAGPYRFWQSTYCELSYFTPDLDSDPLAPPGILDWGQTQLQWLSPNEINVSLSRINTGWVVVLESLLPGWKASVDGEPRDIFPAQIAFMAVPVSSTEREVVLRYRPATFRLGLFLTLLCFGMFAGMAVGSKKGSSVGLPSRSW